MTRQQKIDFIIKYYNDHFKWQRLVEGKEIDRSKVEALTDEQLDDCIKNHCK